MVRGRSFKRSLRACWNKHGQLIMTGLTIISSFSAVIEAVKATKKAEKIKEAREERLNEASYKLEAEEITVAEYEKELKEANIEAAKNYILCYGTTGAMLLLCAGTSVANYRISIGKQATMLAAWKLAESKLEKKDEILTKAKEFVGDEKYEEIEKAALKDRIDKATFSNEITPLNGDTPCWIDETSHPFMSSVSKIDAAMMKASIICNNKESVTMNEIYKLLDPNELYLKPSSYGESHGFIKSQLDDNMVIPYEVSPMIKEGLDCSVAALIFTLEPVKLNGFW